jgi:hypothetical protein
MSATTDSVIDGASMALLLETLLDDSKIMRKTQDEKNVVTNRLTL